MNKSKEPITLRQRKMPSGRVSLYLDIYLNGKRTYEYLRGKVEQKRAMQEIYKQDTNKVRIHKTYEVCMFLFPSVFLYNVIVAIDAILLLPCC